LIAETTVNGKPFLVGTSHLESMDSAEIRRIQCEVVQKVMNQNGFPHVFMGDFNFDFSWKHEKGNFDWENYSDLWGDLKTESEKNWTMPQSKQYAPVCFDHIILSKNQGWKSTFIQRIGNFSCPSFGIEKPAMMRVDGIIRTPSDHLGLIGVISVEDF
jgi:endonuclease/exonuclease/phosphatase family metal-dependent hydrolase